MPPPRPPEVRVGYPWPYHCMVLGIQSLIFLDDCREPAKGARDYEAKLNNLVNLKKCNHGQSYVESPLII